MKKALIAAAAVFMLAGCGNQTFIDTTYTFNYAYVGLPDGSVVEGTVEAWKDYSESDQLQVKIDGVTYLSHSSNIVLISK